jgi:hypothetical protein
MTRDQQDAYRRGTAEEPNMLIDRPRFKIALSAIWLLGLSGLSYTLYAKTQGITGCHARLDELQLIETRTAQTETLMDATEAALDAAEARLDKASDRGGK